MIDYDDIKFNLLDIMDSDLQDYYIEAIKLVNKIRGESHKAGYDKAKSETITLVNKRCCPNCGYTFFVDKSDVEPQPDYEYLRPGHVIIDPANKISYRVVQIEYNTITSDEYSRKTIYVTKRVMNNLDSASDDLLILNNKSVRKIDDTFIGTIEE